MRVWQFAGKKAAEKSRRAAAVDQAARPYLKPKQAVKVIHNDVDDSQLSLAQLRCFELMWIAAAT